MDTPSPWFTAALAGFLAAGWLALTLFEKAL